MYKVRFQVGEQRKGVPRIWRNTLGTEKLISEVVISVLFFSVGRKEKNFQEKVRIMFAKINSRRA